MYGLAELVEACDEMTRNAKQTQGPAWRVRRDDFYRVKRALRNLTLTEKLQVSLARETRAKDPLAPKIS